MDAVEEEGDDEDSSDDPQVALKKSKDVKRVQKGGGATMPKATAKSKATAKKK